MYLRRGTVKGVFQGLSASSSTKLEKCGVREGGGGGRRFLRPVDVREGCFVLVNSGLMICVSRSRRVVGRVSILVWVEIREWACSRRDDICVPSGNEGLARTHKMSSLSMLSRKAL